MAPSCEGQQIGFRFWRLLRAFQRKIVSRISLDRLLNKIYNSSVSKDWKIEAICGLPEQQETLCLLETSHAARRGGKSRKRQASVNGDVVSNAFCSERRTHQTYLHQTCLCSRFLWCLEWRHEAKRLKKGDICFYREKSKLLSFTKWRQLIKVKTTDTLRTTRHWSVSKPVHNCAIVIKI